MKCQENTKNRQDTENRFDPTAIETVEVLGLPIARITQEQMLDMVDHLIAEQKPNFFITANLHYAKLCDSHPELAEVNRKAAFIVADGMPLVWSSWLKPRKKLPGRVTGSDGLFQICQRAAQRGYRVFLLGAAPEIAVRAAEELRNRYPGLKIVGIETPMLSELDKEEMARLITKIRDTSPDILFVAFGQPKGEIWLSEHLEELGVPACIQIGASLDFAAGKMSRAPRWMQRTGTEWLYRLSQEPKRLLSRYFTDAIFFLRYLLGWKKSRKTV